MTKPDPNFKPCLYIDPTKLKPDSDSEIVKLNDSANKIMKF